MDFKYLEARLIFIVDEISLIDQKLAEQINNELQVIMNLFYSSERPIMELASDLRELFHRATNIRDKLA